MASLGIQFEPLKIIDILAQIAKVFFRLIFQGLVVLHEHQLVHMDLKPANILVTEEGVLKISDFGLAMKVDGCFNSSLLDVEGDKCYMAKEVLEGNISAAADIFSLGLIGFELGSNAELPKYGEMWVDLREGKGLFMLPTELRDIVKHMMSMDPLNRPTAIDIFRTLEREIHLH